MDWVKISLAHLTPLVVVHYFHTIGVSALPYKTDAPLVVYPDTMLSGATSLKLLKPVGEGHSQEFQLTRCGNHFELPGRHALNIMREAARKPPLIDPFSFPTFKRSDHA